MFTTSTISLSSSFKRTKHGKVLAPSFSSCSSSFSCSFFPINLVLFYFSVLVIASAIPITTCFDDAGYLIQRDALLNSFNPDQQWTQMDVQPSNKSFMVNTQLELQMPDDLDQLLLKRISDRDMLMLGTSSDGSPRHQQIFLVTDYYYSSGDDSKSYPRYSKLAAKSHSPLIHTFVPLDHKSDLSTTSSSSSIQVGQVYVNSLLPNCFILTDATKPLIYTSCSGKSPEGLQEKTMNQRADFIKILSSNNLVALTTSSGSGSGSSQQQVSMSLSTNFGDTWTDKMQEDIYKLPNQLISDSVKFYENQAYFLRKNPTTSQTELVALDMTTHKTALIDDNTLAFDVKNEILFYFKNDTQHAPSEVVFVYKNLTINHTFPQKRLSHKLFPRTFGKCLDFKLVSIGFDHNKPVFGVLLVHQRENNQVLSELVVVSDHEMWASYKCDKITGNGNLGAHISQGQDYFLWNRKHYEESETRFTKASEPFKHCGHVYAAEPNGKHLHLDNFGNLNRLKDQALSHFDFKLDDILLATGFNKQNQIDGIYSIGTDFGAADAKWHRLLDGHYFYEFSSQDKMIIAAESIEPTTQIIVSDDQGKTWQSFTFSAKAVQVKGLVYHDGSSTVTVFCLDPETRKWLLKDIRLSYETSTTDNDDDNDDNDDDDDGTEDPAVVMTTSTATTVSTDDSRDDVQKSAAVNYPPAALDEKIAIFVAINKNAIIIALTVLLLLSFTLILVVLACCSRRKNSSKSIAKHLELFKFQRKKRHAAECLWRHHHHSTSLSLNCFASKFKPSSPIHGKSNSTKCLLNVEGIDSKEAQINPAFLGASTRALATSSEVLGNHHLHHHQNLRFHTVPEDYHPLI